nr:zf-HC2 domain-containing protein [uncultured Desulfobacter sp.]
MHCDNFQNKLFDFLEGMLSEDEAEELREHLSSCSDCQHELSVLTTVLNFEKLLDDVEPPSFLASRVLAHIIH